MAVDQGPRRRDYVVLQEIELRELLELVDDLDKFGPVYVKAEVVQQARNAEMALTKAGPSMLRPAGDGPVVVPGIAVPATQWTSEPVNLTPRLDVSVG